MSARCSLVVNGKSVRIATGDTPLDAAVADGMIASAQAPTVPPFPDRARARARAGFPAAAIGSTRSS